MSLAKKKKKKKINFENFVDFGPHKSFNLRRFFSLCIKLKGGGGTCPKCPPVGYAPEQKRLKFLNRKHVLGINFVFIMQVTF